MAVPIRPSMQTPTSQPEANIPQEQRIQELSDSDDAYEDMGTATVEETANIAYLNSIRIPIEDLYTTDTSTVQDDTYAIIAPFLEGNPNDFPLNEYGIPKLQRAKHAAFLKKTLGDYPAPFAQMDSSRPWLVYWGLQSMTALGIDTSSYHERVSHTFALAQHPTGGYGGGPGQLPHLACSYASILSLAIAGGPATYASINRASMWRFLGRMKQASGGFTMAAGGEQDIRGAFCACVILALLNLPLSLPPDAPARAAGLTHFTSRLGAWVSSCQSWDGGISAAPGNEAHGAYAFCGLGCLALLGAPAQTLPAFLDVARLTRWLQSRQCAPEGGYNGRTNKLVDGCYSHWIGGCWAILDAALSPTTPSPSPSPSTSTLPPHTDLWNRTALSRYILAACQDPRGGLKDKPGKAPDAYHTCYNLAGLSAAQHRCTYDPAVNKDIGQGDLGAAFHWRAGPWEGGGRNWGAEDVVRGVHPVFVVPFGCVWEMRAWFEREGRGEAEFGVGVDVE
ncbi:CAAX farnesyltransferase (FTase) subunit beta [Coniothyrium glycines]